VSPKLRAASCPFSDFLSRSRGWSLAFAEPGFGAMMLACRLVLKAVDGLYQP
jgi:hypothetical protein